MTNIYTMRTPTQAAELRATNAELQAVLSAWQDATSRLEKTHLVLQEEVHRLSNELEIKNRELARKNRLADLGQLASHVAHEVRNNLVPVTLYLGMLKRRLEADSESQDVLNKVAVGVADMDALVNDLLHFAAEREPQFHSTPLRSLIQDCMERLSPQLTAHGISISLDVDECIALPLDADMFRRVVLNLVINAIDVMPDGGQVEIAANVKDGVCHLTIGDSGPGIPPAVMPRLFEPFFSTKGSGAGLGLAIAAHVVERHDGTLTASNRPTQQGGGAILEVVVPAVVKGSLVDVSRPFALPEKPCRKS
ncbi:MAG: ATP-binding protein [Pirellulales bacterium]|nr:ATP-binding protein [Pirellulales bacterium]